MVLNAEHFKLTSTSSAREMYGGLDTIISYFAEISEKQSDLIKERFRSCLLAFSVASSNASLEISAAVTDQYGLFLAKARAIAPLPVPISSTLRFFLGFSVKIEVY